jgi:hypothetical protein
LGATDHASLAISQWIVRALALQKVAMVMSTVESVQRDNGTFFLHSICFLEKISARPPGYFGESRMALGGLAKPARRVLSAI